ncbi:thiamine pyrophosphate-dependent dehydrogenase E1 component subunit alpha [Arhodomonas aquaeolei]|uniref:thiamine pyrophosphate-dependent dehydrogenase E1 component subunit alpha n=1 Tax=Arhodomonas aquaeolei TaxID=2369 RepID=UPI002168BA6B|nr:thiamine pyrophosphate-dependent dehydrogenase E1 component subunit alpha [Arhodomonas aquaeolei]MCS4503768.1 thiamine pyrophosphate-dependent dehydrogenase E1 component subunit alpha [Arhodomonas aquaeolei]
MYAPSSVDAPRIHTPDFITESALTIPIYGMLGEDGRPYEGADPSGVAKEIVLAMHDAAVFTRLLDERMVAAQRQGRLSFYLTATGEEAATVGSAAGLEPDDMILPQYREQGALRYRGFTAAQFMDQLFATEDDLGKGRQMPVHYGSRALSYMTVSSPLATQIPQAAGYAYGQKLAGEGRCSICYFGEGAASEGDFHAALNMAAVIRCPVIFFCRNNGYAISTPVSEQYAGDGVAARGVGYGVRSIRVDGNDFLAVYLATQEARRQAVSEGVPVLIEAMTYRLGAHSTSDDPSGYRSRKEEEAWQRFDPIARIRAFMEAQGWWDAERDEARRQGYRDEILAAMKTAEAKPAPSLARLIEDVYAAPPWNLTEQYEALREQVRANPDAYPKTAGRIE